jgi:hypothetical protein
MPQLSRRLILLLPLTVAGISCAEFRVSELIETVSLAPASLASLVSFYNQSVCPSGAKWRALEKFRNER